MVHCVECPIGINKCSSFIKNINNDSDKLSYNAAFEMFIDKYGEIEFIKEMI